MDLWILFALNMAIFVVSRWWEATQNPFYWIDVTDILKWVGLFTVCGASLWGVHRLTREMARYVTLGYTVINLIYILHRMSLLYLNRGFRVCFSFLGHLLLTVVTLDSAPTYNWLEDNMGSVTRGLSSVSFTWQFRREMRKAEKWLNTVRQQMKSHVRSLDVQQLRDKQTLVREIKTVVNRHHRILLKDGFSESVIDHLDLVLLETWDETKVRLLSMANVAEGSQERRFMVENEIDYFYHHAVHLFKYQVLIKEGAS